MNNKILFGILRILFGFIFLWAFLDKLFGLGFSTIKAKSWLLGNSPTYGFLSSSQGPLKFLYTAIAGNAFVDWLFMLGLLLIGLSLILGIGLKIAYYSASLLVVLMWSAKLPPSSNPIIDQHIIYLIIFLIMVNVDTTYLSFNKFWKKLKIVKRYNFLE